MKTIIQTKVQYDLQLICGGKFRSKEVEQLNEISFDFLLMYGDLGFWQVIMSPRFMVERHIVFLRVSVCLSVLIHYHAN